MVYTEKSPLTKIKAGDEVPRHWKRWFHADKEHSAGWRREASEAFDFFAGRQWSEADKQKLAEELRPAITFDRSSVIIDAISGNEIQQRNEVQFLPREIGDAIPNEMYTEAARWFDDQAEAADEDSEAFVDCTMAGMGWTESLIEFDENPDGDPSVSRMNPLEMYWDNGAAKGNLRDARRLWRARRLSVEEAKEILGDDHEVADMDASHWVDATDIDTQMHSNDPENWYTQGEQQFDDDYTSNGVRDRVTVIHMQYWVYEPYYKVMDPFTNKVVDMDEDDYAQVTKKLKPYGLQDLGGVKLRRKRYYQAFIGRKVLKHVKGACETGFTWQCMTAKRDRKTNTWYGLYRAMKDPQDWANKWLSQILHILNSNAKGGMFYEAGVFTDQTEAEENMARPDGMVEVKSGALVQGRIKERGNAQFPTGFQVLTEFAIAAIRDVVGVNLEFLGMREATQPGVLEYQRRQAGMTVLAPLFNSLRKYRVGRGRVLLYFIDNYLSDGRLIQIVGQSKKKYVPLVKQADARYDVIIDESPTSPNQKEAVWQSFMHILPGVKDIVPPNVMLELLDYSPLPATVVEKIKEVVKARTPEQEQQAKLKAQMAIAELKKTQSEAARNMAQAQKAMADAKDEEPIELPNPIDQIKGLAEAKNTASNARLLDARTAEVWAKMGLLPSEMDLKSEQAEKTRRERENPPQIQGSE